MFRKISALTAAAVLCLSAGMTSAQPDQASSVEQLKVALGLGEGGKISTPVIMGSCPEELWIKCKCPGQTSCP